MITNTRKKLIGMENQSKIHPTENNFFSENVILKCHTGKKCFVFNIMKIYNWKKVAIVLYFNWLVFFTAHDNARC